MVATHPPLNPPTGFFGGTGAASCSLLLVDEIDRLTSDACWDFGRRRVNGARDEGESVLRSAGSHLAADMAHMLMLELELGSSRSKK